MSHHQNNSPMMTLQQAFDLLRARIPGARLVGEGATPLARVHTDTRTLAAGDLFVALKGERFDAHQFLSQARTAGAAAAIAHAGLADAGLPGIEVPDTLAALGCDTIQGYWVSRPLPFDDLITFFATSGVGERQLLVG